MVKRLTILWAALLAAGCHKGYDLDLRRMGADAGYFVECYCVPDELFCLTATRIAPIDQDQYLDYSLEFETWITAGEEFRLLHSLYHDGSYIYNYASSRRFDPAAADSVRLRMTAPDGTLIAASTAIHPKPSWTTCASRRDGSRPHTVPRRTRRRAARPNAVSSSP